MPAPPFAGTYQHLYVDMYPEALKAYGNEHIREHPQDAGRTTGRPLPRRPARRSST